MGILKKAFRAIKNSFNLTLKELKAFIKEYKRLSQKEKIKKKLGEKGDSSESKISPEKAEELRNKYAEWRQKISETVNISNLNPRNYHSKDELYLAILEDMGLNENFKNNPKAKEDLTELFKYIARDMSQENPKIEEYLQKEFRDFTEQDAQFLKEKLGENQKLKIDEQGNLKYTEYLQEENNYFLDEDAYNAIYLRREYKLQGSNYEQEIIEKRCTMIHDEIENEFLGNGISNNAYKYIYNQDGIEMSLESHEAITEYVQDIKGADIWSYINGDDQDVESISNLENAFSQALERYDVMGVCYGYQDKSTEPHDKGIIRTMNDSEDLAYLKINVEKVEAVQNKYIQHKAVYEKEMRLSDEDKERILKEKIEKSSKKEALTRMGQEAGILDREEQRTQ